MNVRRKKLYEGDVNEIFLTPITSHYTHNRLIIMFTIILFCFGTSHNIKIGMEEDGKTYTKYFSNQQYDELMAEVFSQLTRHIIHIYTLDNI
jgi:hypothetical protein